MIGLIGRGYWGNVWAGVMAERGVPFWQAGRDWPACPRPDRVIVASSTESHYEVACRVLDMGIPVLIEKPAALKAAHVIDLATRAGVVMFGHTRLYDPKWGEFKARAGRATRVTAYAGGRTERNPDEWLNWISHLVPMCCDMGFTPEQAVFNISVDKVPLRLVADGHEFRDTGGALANMLEVFERATDKDEAGFQYALRVATWIEGRHGLG